MEATAWGDSLGITWATASPTLKESFALTRLFWFFRMIDSGGPDPADDLDQLVYAEAKEAAEWYGPILRQRAENAI